MKTVFQFFVVKHKLSLLLSVFFVIYGIMGFKSLQRESRPPVDFARVSITTPYNGASPAEIEEQITNKIEDELRSVRGLKTVKSISQAGLSTISIRIDMDNVETKEVVDELQRSLQKVTGLPTDLLDNPVFFYMNAKEIPILEMAIVGPNNNRQRDRLVDEFKDILEDDKGVAEVRLSGYLKREFQILLNPDKMRYHHVGIKEVVQAVQRETRDIPAGYIRQPGDQRLVRVTGKVSKAEDLKNIVVRSNFSGQRITIADIAQVRDDDEDPSTLVRVNSTPASLIIVTKKENADSIKVTQSLRDEIKKFKENRLPPGFEIVEYNNEANRIENNLNIVINNAIIGLILVLIILLIFLPGVLGVVSALSLPLAVLGTVGLMPTLGVNFNNITMLALIIAIGMLVDNAVVISENYARLRLEGLDRTAAAIKAAHQFWLPLTATVLTTIVAFLPMLVTKGVMGEFIKWIPIMVTIALSMSLLEAFILLPGRLKFTIRNLDNFQDPTKPTKSTWFDPFIKKFEYFMYKAVHKRYIVLIGISSLLIASILLAIFGNRFELFPAEQVEYYNCGFETPITTTIEKTDELAGKLSQTILEKMGKDKVKYIVSRAGVTRFGNSSDSKNGDYVGMLTIAIHSDVAKVLNPKDVLKELRSIPNGEFTKLYFTASRGGPPVGDALSLTFRSNYHDELLKFVNEVKKEVATKDGVVDLQDDIVRGGPEYRIIPDHKAIARLELSTMDIGTALRTALQGSVVQEMSINGEEVRIKVRYSDDDRAKFTSLRDTKIMEPTGRLIPLMSLVKLEEAEAPAVRKHYDYKLSVTLSADVIPQKITSVEINQFAKQVIDKIKYKYPAVNVVFGGEAESTKESTSSLMNAMIIAIFGIFIILVFLFNSFLHPILVLSCIMLGLVGVSWAFFFHQRPLSFLAMIGVVGLAGVVVNSAIVLVSYINELREENDGKTLEEKLALASSHRLRAVLVTSLTTVGGLFPTAYGIGGSDAILIPMTLALAWGLVSGTLLTLIWVPCGYAIVEDVNSLFTSLVNKIFFKKEESR